jgi:hypothetical protein
MPGPKNQPGDAAEEAPPGEDVNSSSETTQITKTETPKIQIPRELQSPKFLAEKTLPAPITTNEYELLDPMYSCNMLGSVSEKTDFSELFNSSTFTPDFSYSQLTLLCFIVNPTTDKKKLIRCTFDSCSNITILKKSVAEDLQLDDGEDYDLTFSGSGGVKGIFKNNKKVRFYLHEMSNKYRTTEIEGITLPTVSANADRVSIDPKQFSHLKDITDFTEELPQTAKQFKKHGEVDLLLGLPYFMDVACEGASTGTFGPPEPMALHTKLGSCITMAMNYQHSYHHQTMMNPDITLLMRLDVLGITDLPDENNDLTYEEHQAKVIIREGTTYDRQKKQYTTVLPWKLDEEGKPAKIKETNKAQAYATGHQWKKKLERRGEEVLTGWMKTYQDMIDGGHSEKVPQEEMNEENCHYIQTFAVEQPNKPTHPVRLVFAANQKQKGSQKSLNDHLLTGPNNLTDLIKLVLRFRLYPYVFNLDVSRMFFRTKVAREDRDYLRFFALKKEDDKYKFEAHRMTSYPFGLSSSPFVCTYLLRMHAERFLEDHKLAKAAQQIIAQTYMDDILVGHETEEGLLDTVKDVITILDSASLPTHKFVSNSIKALQAFPEECLSNKDKVSVLGTMWSPRSDIITYNLIAPVASEEEGKTTTINPTVATKRVILSTLARIFDPQGLVAPYALVLKLLLQECWKEKKDWDESPNEDIQKSFDDFTRDLPLLEKITLKRCLLPTPQSRMVEIVTFADASEHAYGCVVYAIAEDEKQNRTSTLIFSKTRVRPLGKNNQQLTKDMSICRMELQAAWVAAKAGTFCKSAFPDVDVTMKYFSDSQVTLCRLQNDYAAYRVFVANRLKTIKQNTTSDDWYYVKTDENPADFASRGKPLQELIASKLWLEGPEFLRDPYHDYEKMKIKNIIISKENARLVKEEMKVTTPYFTNLTNQIDGDEEFTQFHLETNSKEPRKNGFIKKFSSWNKLVRITGRILQFAKACKKGYSNKIKTKPKKNTRNMRIEDEEENKKILNDHLLSAQELGEAELLLFRIAQRLSLKEEIIELQKAPGKPVDKKNSKLRKLITYLKPEDGLIRMMSRMPQSDLVILPKKNPITELFVTYNHVINNHCGTNNLRARCEKVVYVLGGKQEYKRITKCCTCRQPRSLYQAMGDLPPERCPSKLEAHRFIAMDYAGPFYHYEEPGKKEQKCWILLVSCLVTRHLHVELVKSCSTEAFLLALRAYISIYGVYQKAFSDQATYFVKASKELKSILRKVDFNRARIEMNQKYGNDWEFSTPEAPYKMGIVESAVKLFKSALDKALSHTYRTDKRPGYFDFENLRVVCLEMGQLINDRPLAVIEEDVKGVATQIHVSPNLLSKGREGNILPIQADFPTVKSHTNYDIRTVYKTRKRFLNLFWNEYLATYGRKLKLTPKWHQRFEAQIPEGQFLFLKEKGIKPGQFISARVVKVHKRPNGTVSNLDLVTSDHKSVVRRDVRQVYLLEHDYHKLVNPGSECLLEDSTTKNKVLMTSLYSQLTNLEAQKPVATLPRKRGVERCFSTKTYVN